MDLPGKKQRCVVFAITIVTLRVIYKKVHFDESFSTLHGKFYVLLSIIQFCTCIGGPYFLKIYSN